jgi:hypothetical protein
MLHDVGTTLRVVAGQKENTFRDGRALDCSMRPRVDQPRKRSNVTQVSLYFCTNIFFVQHFFLLFYTLLISLYLRK